MSVLAAAGVELVLHLDVVWRGVSGGIETQEEATTYRPCIRLPGSLNGKPRDVLGDSANPTTNGQATRHNPRRATLTPSAALWDILGNGRLPAHAPPRASTMTPRPRRMCKDYCPEPCWIALACRCGLAVGRYMKPWASSRNGHAHGPLVAAMAERELIGALSRRHNTTFPDGASDVDLAWANDPRGREHRVMPRYRRWGLQRWLGLAVAPWFLRKFTNKLAFMHHVAQGGRAGGGIGITSPAPFFQRPRERGAEAGLDGRRGCRTLRPPVAIAGAHVRPVRAAGPLRMFMSARLPVCPSVRTAQRLTAAGPDDGPEDALLQQRPGRGTLCFSGKHAAGGAKILMLLAQLSWQDVSDGTGPTRVVLTEGRRGQAASGLPRFSPPARLRGSQAGRGTRATRREDDDEARHDVNEYPIYLQYLGRYASTRAPMAKNEQRFVWHARWPPPEGPNGQRASGTHPPHLANGHLAALRAANGGGEGRGGRSARSGPLLKLKLGAGPAGGNPGVRHHHHHLALRTMCACQAQDWTGLDWSHWTRPGWLHTAPQLPLPPSPPSRLTNTTTISHHAHVNRSMQAQEQHISEAVGLLCAGRAPEDHLTNPPPVGRWNLGMQGRGTPGSVFVVMQRILIHRRRRTRRSLTATIESAGKRFGKRSREVRPGASSERLIPHSPSLAELSLLSTARGGLVRKPPRLNAFHVPF
ncbi:hypothetical protein Purlil1_10400 [Purpureocillium lilacinum]|uniref:Uncharacterized protein n=1 Tax=Purpureocillium lilacinum TaxID=33203 RepID=A0ABR0BMY7_PURLI|nr:hypothetical protein Purlil1_10400 [Purpureocillium lilacinum]